MTLILAPQLINILVFSLGVVPKWSKGSVCKTAIRRFESGRRLNKTARVMELVDMTDLKSVG